EPATGSGRETGISRLVPRTDLLEAAVKRTKVARIPRGERGERGAAAVEFVLVLPLLVALIFGLIDFGRAYNQQIALTQLSRKGDHAMSGLMRRVRSAAPERGAVAALVAVIFGAGVLMASGAIVVDVGQAYSERGQLQNGADSASLAVARGCARGTTYCDPAI